MILFFVMDYVNFNKIDCTKVWLTSKSICDCPFRILDFVSSCKIQLSNLVQNKYWGNIIDSPFFYLMLSPEKYLSTLR